MSIPKGFNLALCIMLPIAIGSALFSSAQQTDYTTFVDPFIGTGGHGHTFPGATMPFGMVQLSPDTRDDGSWDGCSGYHYSDSLMFGFSHTHLSGTGCSDYGDILMMPVPDSISLQRKYSARFQHKNEKAAAGFYSVKLDNGITADLAATTRCGIHKYTFPSGTNPAVLLDLIHRDKVTEGYMKIVDKKTIEGFRRSEAWAKNQVVYFRIEFDKPFLDYRMISDSMKKDNIRFKNEYFGKIKALFRFDVRPGESLMAKVSISGVDLAGTEKNMQQELPAFDFEKVKADAKAAWNKELSKIEVSGGTDAHSLTEASAQERMNIFYTALYHCFIQPNIYNDVDGRYRGRDFKIHTAEGFNYYTVFSLWDTFRAWHPLMTIIDKQRTLDFIKTFLAQYEQVGLLPVWELSSNETECMIGYHSVSVIADAAVKGITGFDMEKAFAAMKKSAESRNRYGLGAYMDKGMIETDDEGESVSRTLEYAYDDWCIAQMAQLLKKDDDYRTYMDRSQYWKNLFDPATGFIRPRKNGGWYQPFDAREVNNNYTEANAWQYNFFTPHDQGALARMMGIDQFYKKLDSLFAAKSETTGREQSDITGLIGQYAHGNEPSHHMAYLYQVRSPHKMDSLVGCIMNDFYHASPDGLIGNEDCGQMSAWYVMSALGIYQVCPGSKMYSLTVPLFAEAKINLENGKSFTIKKVHAEKASPGHYYRYFENKKSDFVNYFTYDDFANHSVLNLDFSGPARMTDKVITHGNDDIKDNRPHEIVLNPVIQTDSDLFRDKLTVTIEGHVGSNSFNKDRFAVSAEGQKIYYTTDGSDPTINSILYETGSKIVFEKTTTLKTFSVASNGDQSKIVTGTFSKLPHPDWKIKYVSPYDPQYTAGGDEALIDGLRGDINWRKGYWQGFEGKDFECIIDMGSEQEVSSISTIFLQDIGAWIFMPKRIEISFSKDSVNYSDFMVIGNNVSEKEEKVLKKTFKSTLVKPVTARYIKVKAISFGKLPSWHAGAGNDSWIFVDEITIN